LQKNAFETSGDVLQNQKWAIACSAITFTITLVVVGLHLHPIGQAIIVGNKIEGILILILAAFWTATVSIVSDASHGLAVNEDGVVSNGNLYYFSWAGFVTSIMLFVSYLRAVFGVDVAGELSSRSARLSSWAALLACQLIVLGSSANLFDQKCGSRAVETEEYCRRTKFAISVGAIGTAFALAIVGMKIATSNAPFLFEAAFAIIMTVLNAFGVAYTTSPDAPGAGLGNLYYFSWLSLIASLMLLMSCFEEYRSPPAVQDASQAPKTDDIQVEPLEEGTMTM